MNLTSEELARLDTHTLVEMTLRKDQRIAELEARILALETRLNQNSKNSSKPPSKDPPFRKWDTKTDSGKKSGGQPGQEGHGLRKVESPDRIMDHSAASCSHCGYEFPAGDAADTETVGSWQVHDLPVDLRIEVTEHRRLSHCCPKCHLTTVASLPLWLSEQTPCQWGPGCRTLGVYLMQQQHLPYERTQSVFRDLLGSAPSEGTLFNWLKEAHANLKPVEEAITGALVQSEVVGADETSARGAGWLHCLVNDDYTWYGCHKKRGREAMESFGLLPRLQGLLMTDCLGSYSIYGKDRSLCNAHLIRDLTGVFENGHDWPRRMIDLILKIKKISEESIQPLSRSMRNGFYREYGKILASGDREESAKSVPKADALISRLYQRRDEYLRFATTPGAWFDNNRSENSLRMTKLHVKISGCFRSTIGCEILCRVRGYLSTMRKQRQPLFAALRSVMERTPAFPPLLQPAL